MLTCVCEIPIYDVAGGDEVCWRCYNESATVRAAILDSGRALDDDGFKFVVRTFLERAQATVGSLGKGRKTSVWNEAFGTEHYLTGISLTREKP